MSPHRHPGDETLLRYAAGRLSAGLRLVTAVHLESCTRCREQAARLESLGGVLLESQKPAPVSPASLEKIFAAIDAGDPAPPLQRPAAPVLADGFQLPASMAGCEIGPWRFVHPKLRWARVAVPGAPKESAILLRIAAGHAAPAHAHRGLELTQVLCGAFADGRGVYGPGDLVEADADVIDHQPRVTEDGECLCLAAVERPLRLNSLVARLFQPLMGI
jgi:putative transcriptional regulator